MHPPHPLILTGIPLALLFTWTPVADLLTSTSSSRASEAR
jgi:hypothetical protein